MARPLRLLSIGEPLVELVAAGGDRFRRQVGGDTLNTAIYAARLLGPGQVGYHSALGTDPLSDWVLERIMSEGIATGTILRAERAPVGLCAVHTDAAGERSFTYWRGQSPARRMLDPGQLFDPGSPEILFTSAVTLAILAPESRERLLDLMAGTRANGGQVAFDMNLRPALWTDLDTARAVVLGAVQHATLVLPSEDDIRLLWPGATVEEVVARLTDAGTDEVVLTRGGAGVLHALGTLPPQRHELPPPRAAVDTTGAGDAFNAGFLAARLSGASTARAIDAGHRLAAHVVGFPGAVIPVSDMPV